jgi:hypothetical protein
VKKFKEIFEELEMSQIQRFNFNELNSKLGKYFQLIASNTQSSNELNQVPKTPSLL